MYIHGKNNVKLPETGRPHWKFGAGVSLMFVTKAFKGDRSRFCCWLFFSVRGMFRYRALIYQKAIWMPWLWCNGLLFVVVFFLFLHSISLPQCLGRRIPDGGPPNKLNESPLWHDDRATWPRFFRSHPKRDLEGRLHRRPIVYGKFRFGQFKQCLLTKKPCLSRNKLLLFAPFWLSFCSELTRCGTSTRFRRKITIWMRTSKLAAFDVL